MRCLRRNQVGHRLGLSQIELAVAERPVGKLAWLRRAGPGGKQGVKERTEKKRRTVRADLDGVFAGVRTRSLKDRQVPTVQRLALRVEDGPEDRLPMPGRTVRRRREKDRLRETKRLGTADSNDPEPTPPLRGGDGRDGVVVLDQ